MEIFDKKGGDVMLVAACSVWFLAAMASLAGFFYVLDECEQTTVTKPTVGVYDEQLDAYCSLPDAGEIPQTSYVLSDGSVIYITSCQQATNLGIIDGTAAEHTR